MKFSKEEIVYFIACFLFGFTVMYFLLQNIFTPIYNNVKVNTTQRHWQIESIDTMKYSRDRARQGITDPLYAIEVDKQVGAIADAGANYVAIDTPYDDEFLPVLKMWVHASRAHGLHVWFRGNWSGWEGWFNYSPINEQTHIAKTKAFILDHPDLFQNGDIFTSCPECENGAKLSIGDTQAVASYRSFLITEYTEDTAAFDQIGKKVKNGYFSMNLDAAKAIMDPETTQQLGGIVVIDHYVKTPDDLANGVSSIAAQSGGRVILGEFGAPIPDINGSMTADEQKQWLDQSLQLLSKISSLDGVNYWVNKGGSTALWHDDGSPKPAVAILSQFYQNTK